MQILKDDATLAEAGVTEAGFCVVMIMKVGAHPASVAGFCFDECVPLQPTGLCSVQVPCCSGYCRPGSLPACALLQAASVLANRY